MTKTDARPKKETNLLVRGIIGFLDRYENHAETESEMATPSIIKQLQLTNNAVPKRYTIYPPMLLVGPNFETFKPEWQTLWTSLNETDKSRFWNEILNVFQDAGQTVDRVAMNAPIASALSDEYGKPQIENIMRSPVGLQPLFGSFGPDQLLSASRGERQQPGPVDFEAAVWVECVQLKGIVQVWAPRWTMFSRGNIKEKDRILTGLPVQDYQTMSKSHMQIFPGLTQSELNQDLKDVDVIDFYIGIGYFAFCYLKRGARRVWGWELNGWSVEGLRRGCERNGWKCLVVNIDDQAEDHTSIADLVATSLSQEIDLRCIIFQGDNRWAKPVMNAIQTRIASFDRLNVRHCNLGLLPTSRRSWDGARSLLHPDREGWLHVHENAVIESVNSKKDEVLQTLRELSVCEGASSWQVSCEHVQMVKTYAPGVGHFVFDIQFHPVNPT